MTHECAQAECKEDATHLVIESQPLAMLFRTGAGLLCSKHASFYSTIGGINCGPVKDVLEGLHE